DLSGWLPRVDNQWSDFWASQKRSSKYARFYVRLEQFRVFVDSIKPSDKPTLYFMHSMMPHAPWLVLASGKEYEPQELHLSGEKSRRHTWRGDRWAVESDYLRHLLQVGYVDSMLGQLIQKLKEAGLYDKSLIAVTADHGICFNANQSRKSRRHVTAENYSCLLPVPLFIRYPGQKQGSINDGNVQTIDILPTMADMLKVHLPGRIDGISALNPAANQRKAKIGYASNYEAFRFPRIINTMDEVQHKLSLFGNGDSLLWLMALPESAAIGKKTSDFPVKEANIEAELFGENTYQNVDLNSRYVPSLIGGQLLVGKGNSRNFVLGISVNGAIRAVTQTFTVGKEVQGFAAIVPESSFNNGKNEIEVFDMTSNSGELLRIPFKRTQ
ncbi:MAG TPA: sulfatase-like hydrolase/transferase, partial [Acidobacteriota bacterium]|nr:sulfatase-like hydrolase/transferase [Acidobacteriota bacterium]